MKTSKPSTLAAPSGARRWLFRIVALTVVPAGVLLAAEAALRWTGTGEPTAFLVPAAASGHHTPNQKYGWRFFPRVLARTPVPFLLADEKADAYRIFVIGGSAARGTPDSAYSFGRVLELLLEDRYPDARFEVHNAAMTAINSHVALDIVRACARFEPDLFVVYLGNNEVVGPFGAGSVFGTFSPNRTMIRAAINARSTRLGQLVASLVGAGDGAASEWRGMEMFLEQQLAADDPRLEKVYRHFERNLGDMIAAAHRSRAKTLLITVATNLRDQPPFASLHHRDLKPGDRERWQTFVGEGAEQASSGDHAAAIASWRQAEALDDRHAELHYRLGRSLLALGRDTNALEHLARARDLDALRFRADSRINAVIRDAAATGADHGVILLDAARRFEAGTDGHPPLPGRRLFHEHVHLTFEGNFALASLAADALVSILPDSIRRSASNSSTDADTVSERLALTAFDRWSLERDVLDIVSRPPFVDQLDHEADVDQRRLRLGRLKKRLDAGAWEKALATYQRALAEDPDDFEIRRRFALLLQSRGHHTEAAEQWRQLLAKRPEVEAWRAALATSLASDGDERSAMAELDRLHAASGETAAMYVLRGNLFEILERQEAADEAYLRALELAPGHRLASFNLATSSLRRGDLASAEARLRELLTRHDFAPAHHNLGRCLELQGRLEDALAAYRRALDADSGHSPARNSLALALERRGEPDQAISELRLLLAYEPDNALARFNLADLLLSQGRAAEAAIHYRQGLALDPGNAQARANLALALSSQAKNRS